MKADSDTPVLPDRILTVTNRQRQCKIDVRHLRRLASNVLPFVLESPGPGDAPLTDLDAVEISVVSDRTIANLHARFMDDPAPTDVITFTHGEIIISAETAARQAGEAGQELDQELFRYIVHGLLHLNGHEDAANASAAEMWRVQEHVVLAHWHPRSERARVGRMRKHQTVDGTLNAPPGSC